MVVYHSGGLHVGIDDGAADELEAAALEVLADRIGVLRAGGHLLHELPGILDGLAAGESPDVQVKAAEFLLHCKERAGIDNRGLDLEPVAHNCRVLQQLVDPRLVVARNLFRVESAESLAIALALVEYGGPGQSGLRALQDQELE